ncbi:hypothetical protein IE077_003821, partial [Cardiosporidium cionae]
IGQEFCRIPLALDCDVPRFVTQICIISIGTMQIFVKTLTALPTVTRIMSSARSAEKMLASENKGMKWKEMLALIKDVEDYFSDNREKNPTQSSLKNDAMFLKEKLRLVIARINETQKSIDYDIRKSHFSARDTTKLPVGKLDKKITSLLKKNQILESEEREPSFTTFDEQDLLRQKRKALREIQLMTRNYTKVNSEFKEIADQMAKLV